MHNYFKTTLIFLILAELLSIFAWALPSFNLACFGVILLITLILSLKKLEYGLYIAAAELIIGSQGYLFSFQAGSTFISIRMGIFAVVMIAWLVHLLKMGFKPYWRELKQFIFFKHYLALALVLLWGFVWGSIRNDFGNVFLDFNNWLFFLYLLPLISVSPNLSWKNFSQVASAALIWLIIKTILFLYIFSHQFVWALPELYKWVRDTRVGEITAMSNNFYRIFLQSQIFALLAFFILLPRKKTLFFLSAALTAVIISFSRSFWLGLVTGLLIYFIYLLIYLKKEILKKILNLIIISVISIGIIFLIINLPPKIAGENLSSLISKRTRQMEAAGNSRINMLKPLTEAIIKHPLIGSGFGATVTYRSVDPRILSTTAGASGEYTTYAFEWAYLDLLLKIGLVGLFIYLLLIFRILQTLKNSIGLALALITLLVVNIFTPYLNHPLGIGFILIISIYAQSLRHHRHI